jgi:hypothetical protein
VTRIASLVLSFAVLFAGCTNGPPVGPPASGSVNSEPGGPNDAGRYFQIVELGLGPSGYVTLLNYTTQPASLGTLYLCQSSGCVDLPDFIVEPGAVARIAIGDGSGLENVALTGADLDLSPADGEVALTSTIDLENLRTLHGYLEWGSTPHELTRHAVDAKIWLPDTYAPTSSNAVRLFRTEGGLWLFE